MSNSPQNISHIFKLHDSSIGNHKNAASCKSQEIRNLSQNEQPNQSDNMLEYRFKAALLLKVKRIQGISSLLCCRKKIVVIDFTEERERSD